MSLSYSVAIRTLGTAGDKFKKELESLHHQTVPPEKIVIYIADGYSRPDFQVGNEEYVWVKKGMVAQRALQYQEIQSDRILMLDDDVFLAEDSAEKLLNAMDEHGADCVGADTFKNQDMSALGKLKAFVTNLVYPRKGDGWAFKVCRNGSFSYNNDPQSPFCWSECCAGPAALWKKESFLKIHFEDELWMDKLEYQAGDDFLLFYKLHLNNGKLGILYDSGIQHLDAAIASSKAKLDEKRFFVRAKVMFVVWLRSLYTPSKGINRLMNLTCFFVKFIWLFLVNFCAALVYKKMKIIRYYSKGTCEGFSFYQKEVKDKIPSYILKKKMIRVLHVITSLRIGGAEKLMVDLLPRLRELGVDVELCVFDCVETDFMKSVEKQNIKVHKLGSSMYSFRNVLKLIPLIRRFDIVHTHNTPCQFALALLHPIVKGRLITTEHNTSNRRRGKWYWKLLDLWMYRQYDKVICISEAAEKNLRNYIGCNSNKIVTIHNGIDVNRFASAEPLNLKDELHLQCDDELHFAIMVAAFRWEKDQETLIRAYTHLPDNYHLILVGDGERRADIERFIQERNRCSRVHLLGLRSDVPSLLKSSDVVVLSSHFEGLSLSSVEGMASGMPFIASDVDGLRDVVKGYGVLFPEGDDETLARYIQDLSENKEKASLIKDKCQERARMFSIGLMAEKYFVEYCQK